MVASDLFQGISHGFRCQVYSKCSMLTREATDVKFNHQLSALGANFLPLSHRWNLVKSVFQILS